MAIQFLNNQYISGTLEVAGATTFDTVANPGSDTDKFVVINGSGLLGFRTGAELLADIGGSSSATTVTSVSGTQPIISSGGLTPTISLNYTGANNLIESATDLEGSSIATADSIIYNDATDGNVKKGLISDLPFSNTSGTVTSITPGADSGTGTAITTSGTITVAGGSNITTSVSGTTITVNTDFNQYGWSITDGSTTNSIPSGTTVTFQGGTGINTSLNGYILDIEIDSSVVPGGSGTAGKLTKWTATKTLGDGPVTISGSDATFDGHITLASDKKVNFGASSYIEGATSGSKLMFRSSDDMIFQPGGTTKVTFKANGNATFSSGTTTDILKFGPDSRWGFSRANSDSRYVSFMRNQNGSGIAVFTVDGDNGNVGIGTTTPATGYQLTLSDSQTAGLALNDTGQGANYQIAANGAASYWRYDGDNSKSIFLTGTGLVGIGTAAPSASLEVSSANPRVKVTATTGTNPSYLNINNTGGSTYVGMESSVAGSEFTGTTAYASVFGSSGAKDTQLLTSGTVRMTINSSGNTTFAGDILTNTDSSSDIGKTATRWANIWVDSINGGTPTTGSGAANRVTYWSSATNITSDAGFTYNGTGRVSTDESFNVVKDGANTVADGPFFALKNAAGTRQYINQLDASNNIDYWYYNGSAWTQTISFLTDGGATFAGNVSTAADKRISIGTWDNSAFTGGNAYGYYVSSGTPMLILEESDQSKTGYVGVSGGNMYVGGVVTSLILQSGSGSNALTIDSSQNAAFTGTVSGTTATFTTFSGDLNGTINTATTAVTKGNAVNDTTVATTAFVQNVIGTIPAGLVFQGTWNASTNTPTLASGSGTTGHFYIVSVAGSTNLDGVTDWEVGDWAVFIEQGASDQWEKIDNSSVLGGSGSGGSLTAWAGSGTSVTLTNAPVTYSGNNTTFAGDVTTVGNVVTGSSIVLSASNGRITSTQGYFGTGFIHESGGYATFGSNSSSEPIAISIDAVGSTAALKIETNNNATFAGSVDIHATTGDSLLQFNIDGDTYSMGIDNSDSDKFKLAYGVFGSTDLISIATDGYATFTGSIIGNNGIVLAGSNKTLETLYNGSTSYRGALGWSYLQMGNNGSNDIIGGNTAAGGTLRFFTNNTNYCGADVAPNGTLALTLGTTGDATFYGDMSMVKDVPSFDFVDSNSDSDFRLRNNNGVFEVLDTTNSRTLMSLTSGAVITLDSLGSNTVLNTTSSVVVPNGSVGIGTNNPAFPLEVENSSTAYVFSQTTGASASSGYRWKTPDSEFAWFSTGGTNAMALYDYVASAERMRITSAGNVGIGTAVENDINEAKLYVNGTLGLDANSEIKYGKNAGGPYLNIRSKDSSTSACGIRIHSPSGSPGYLYGEGTSGASAYIGILDADGAWGYQIRTDTSHTWLINNSNQMHLTTTGLGIGTTTPVNKLGIAVGANSNTKAINIYSGNTSPNAYTSIGSQYATNNNYVESEIRFGNETQSGGASYLGFVTGGTNTGNTEKMRITSAGNVGIGITPTTIFEVRCASDEHFTISDALSTVALKAHNNGASAYIPMSINASTLALNTDSGGSISFGGDILSTPIFTAGIRVRGGASTPIAGEARIGGHASHGAQFYGSGAGTDLIFLNKNGSTVMSVATGTINTTLAGWLNSTTASFRMSFNVADGDTFMSINHTGNEAWSFKCESLSGTQDVISVGTTGGTTEFDENGQIFSHQKLDVATAGGRLTGKSNRGVLGAVHIEQTATGADGGQIYFTTSPSGSTTPTKRMTIDMAGNVGIGIADPDQALEIGAAGKLKLSRADNARSMLLYTDNSYGTIETDVDPILIKSAHRVSFSLAGSEKVRFQEDGNVGIGTTSPTNGKFVINNLSNATNFGGNVCQLFENFSTTDGQMMSIGFRNNNSVGTTALIDAVAYDQSIGATDLRFSLFSGSAWNSNMVTFQHTGYVGIGVTDPHSYYGKQLVVAAADESGITIMGTASNQKQYLCWASNSTGANAYAGFIAYDHNTNSMSLATNGGAGAITIDNAQNVGIGTTSPTGYRLVVENTSEDLLKLHNSTDGLDALISFTNPGGTLGRIQGIDNGGLGFDVGNNAGGIVSNAMFIQNNGNVGIGNTNPSRPLDITSDSGAVALKLRARSGNDYAFLSFTQNDGSGTIWAELAGMPTGLRMDTNGSQKMRIDNAGSVAIGNFTPSGTPTGDYRSLEIGRQGNTITGAPWKSNLYFSTNATITAGSSAFTYRYASVAPTQMTMEAGVFTWSNAVAGTVGNTISFTERMRITSTGNVGIGTTSPTKKLTVDAGSTSGDGINITGSSSPAIHINETSGTVNSSFQNDGAASYLGTSTSHNLILRTAGTTRFEISSAGKCAINHAVSNRSLVIGGALDVQGTLYKTSGSFAIDHPLESKKDTHKLIHSFIEGPKADNIYRGKAQLKDGSVVVNLDTVSEMTEGTFVLLNRDVQCFTSNESDWDPVKGTIEGSLLTISCKNTLSNAMISWMVVGERQDKEIKESELTDDNGKIIVEPTIEEFEK